MDLIDVLHKIQQDGINELNLTDLVFGTVTKTSPLEIQIEGTMQPIPEAALILTDNVKARTYEGTTGEGDTFSVTLSTALTVGEKALMLRCSHGQRFIVISRV